MTEHKVRRHLSRLVVIMANVVIFLFLMWSCVHGLRHGAFHSHQRTLNGFRRMASNKPPFFRAKTSIQCTKDRSETEKEQAGSEGESTSNPKTEEQSTAEKSTSEGMTIPVEVLEKLEELKKEQVTAEALLRSERQELSKISNKMFEGGKNGYRMVQSQVQQFLKRQDAEKARRLEDNRQEVARKVLPILDAFRAVPTEWPGSTEQELKIHGDFAVLVESIIFALQQYGYAEFGEVGEFVDPIKHEIVEFVSSDTEPGRVARVIRKGLTDKQREVIRKAHVAVSSPHASTGMGIPETDPSRKQDSPVGQQLEELDN